MYNNTFTAKKRKYDESMGNDNEGDVTNVSKYPELFCDWCLIQLPDEASMRQHLLLNEHKRLNNVEDEKKRIDTKCGLFIRGFLPDSDKDSILKYFSQFGKILWVHFNYSYLLLDYKHPESAEKVFNQSNFLGGRKLTVLYRQPRRQIPPKEEEQMYDFIELLKGIPDFNHQLHVLKEHLQPLAYQQFPRYNMVCEDLFKALRSSFPACRINPFGSTITGLGFLDSDVDVFISGIKKAKDDVKYLYRIKGLLSQWGQFSDIIVIPRAKIPILKCHHIPTRVHCDINVRNMLGVCNSHLINYYLSVHPILRDLMIVLKFWAKVHKITGKNHLFTNYSLAMMVIFFLQQPPFRFPPVLVLQQNPMFFNMQDGWNGGFQPMQIICAEIVNIPLLKLLEMFLTFYLQYDYSINVICPYLGYSIKKDSFKDPEKLPEFYRLYKQHVALKEPELKINVPLCIQDPFEHTRNVTPIVSINTLETFVVFCRLGKKLCEENAGGVLYRLFTEVPMNAEVLTIKTESVSKFCVLMRPGLKYIEEKYKTDRERHRVWFANVTNFTVIILKDVLKFDVVEHTNEESKPKHSKTDDSNDVYEEISSLRYKCSVKYNFWQNRKLKTKNGEAEEGKKSVLEKELAITEQLSELYKDVCIEKDVISFELCMEHSTDPPMLAVTITKIDSYKNTFRSFVSFFAAKLPAWYRTYEQECNQRQ